MKLYGVFAGGKWGMTTNKKNAMEQAKKHQGEVRVMPYPQDTHAWDYPTFRVCSDPIADFRLGREWDAVREQALPLMAAAVVEPVLPFDPDAEVLLPLLRYAMKAAGV